MSIVTLTYCKKACIIRSMKRAKLFLKLNDAFITVASPVAGKTV